MWANVYILTFLYYIITLWAKFGPRVRVCHRYYNTTMAPPQGSAKTKQDAEQAFEDTTRLDKQVDEMMDQLSGAEAELAKKKAEADSDMMMASMVHCHLPYPLTHPP